MKNLDERILIVNGKNGEIENVLDPFINTDLTIGHTIADIVRHSYGSDKHELIESPDIRFTLTLSSFVYLKPIKVLNQI